MMSVGQDDISHRSGIFGSLFARPTDAENSRNSNNTKVDESKPVDVAAVRRKWKLLEKLNPRRISKRNINEEDEQELPARPLRSSPRLSDIANVFRSTPLSVSFKKSDENSHPPAVSHPDNNHEYTNDTDTPLPHNAVIDTHPKSHIARDIFSKLSVTNKFQPKFVYFPSFYGQKDTTSSPPPPLSHEEEEEEEGSSGKDTTLSNPYSDSSTNTTATTTHPDRAIEEEKGRDSINTPNTTTTTVKRESSIFNITRHFFKRQSSSTTTTTTTTTTTNNNNNNNNNNTSTVQSDVNKPHKIDLVVGSEMSEDELMLSHLSSSTSIPSNSSKDSPLPAEHPAVHAPPLDDLSISLRNDHTVSSTISTSQTSTIHQQHHHIQNNLQAVSSSPVKTTISNSPSMNSSNIVWKPSTSPSPSSSSSSPKGYDVVKEESTSSLNALSPLSLPIDTEISSLNTEQQQQQQEQQQQQTSSPTKLKIQMFEQRLKQNNNQSPSPSPIKSSSPSPPSKLKIIRPEIRPLSPTKTAQASLIEAELTQLKERSSISVAALKDTLIIPFDQMKFNEELSKGNVKFKNKSENESSNRMKGFSFYLPESSGNDSTNYKDEGGGGIDEVEIDPYERHSIAVIAPSSSISNSVAVIENRKARTLTIEGFFHATRALIPQGRRTKKKKTSTAFGSSEHDEITETITPLRVITPVDGPYRKTSPQKVINVSPSRSPTKTSQQKATSVSSSPTTRRTSPLKVLTVSPNTSPSPTTRKTSQLKVITVSPTLSPTMTKTPINTPSKIKLFPDSIANQFKSKFSPTAAATGVDAPSSSSSLSPTSTHVKFSNIKNDTSPSPDEQHIDSLKDFSTMYPNSHKKLRVSLDRNNIIWHTSEDLIQRDSNSMSGQSVGVAVDETPTTLNSSTSSVERERHSIYSPTALHASMYSTLQGKSPAPNSNTRLSVTSYQRKKGVEGHHGGGGQDSPMRRVSFINAVQGIYHSTFDHHSTTTPVQGDTGTLIDLQQESHDTLTEQEVLYSPQKDPLSVDSAYVPGDYLRLSMREKNDIFVKQLRAAAAQNNKELTPVPRKSEQEIEHELRKSRHFSAIATISLHANPLTPQQQASNRLSLHTTSVSPIISPVPVPVPSHTSTTAVTSSPQIKYSKHSPTSRLDLRTPTSTPTPNRSLDPTIYQSRDDTNFRFSLRSKLLSPMRQDTFENDKSSIEVSVV